MQTYLTDLYNRIEEEHKKIGVFRNLKFSEKDLEAVEKLH